MLIISVYLYYIGQRKTKASRQSEAGSSKSSHSSKISLEYVNTVLTRLQNRQTRNSTLDNYLSVWRQLNKFVINLDFREHLSWEQRTALFGAYLVDNGVQSSTLKSYFSAIKFILKQDGYQWDEKKVLLSSLVKGCKLENDRVKIRLPIKKGLLELLLFELSRKFGEKGQVYLECMYTAMFCLAYYGMMRVGELTLGSHTMKACNIHVGNNKDKIQIVLYTSKTHGQESRPQKIKISAVEGVCNGTKGTSNKQKFLCPFQAVISFMKIRGSYLEYSEQFFVFADKSPVKPHHFRTTLRSLLDNLNLDSSLYDVHSFRSGRTCDLAKFGYSIEAIKAMGRWKSNAVYRYLKD